MDKRKRFYLAILCCGIVGAFLVGVYVLWPSNSRFNRAWKIAPERVQLEVVQELNRRGVPHKVDAQGFVAYQSKYDSVVRELERKVKKKLFPDLPNISFSDEESKQYFLGLLEKNEIPYIIRKLDAKDNDYVQWEEKFDSKVQALISDMNEKMGLTKKPLRLSYSDAEEREILISLLKEEKIPFRLTRNQQSAGQDIEFDWKYDSQVGKLLEKVQEIKNGKR